MSRKIKTNLSKFVKHLEYEKKNVLQTSHKAQSALDTTTAIIDQINMNVE